MIYQWLEILALLTGTLLPAPLLSSPSMKFRFIGFNIMIVGNICAFIAQYARTANTEYSMFILIVIHTRCMVK